MPCIVLSVDGSGKNVLSRKRNALNRYGHRCWYCWMPLTEITASLDHVIPKRLKLNVPYNVRPCCTPCNLMKADLSVAVFRGKVIRLFLFMILNPFWGKYESRYSQSRQV